MGKFYYRAWYRDNHDELTGTPLGAHDQVNFERQKKWGQWLADNKASVFSITDYRQYLMDYFEVDLPEVK